MISCISNLSTIVSHLLGLVTSTEHYSVHPQSPSDISLSSTVFRQLVLPPVLRVGPLSVVMVPIFSGHQEMFCRVSITHDTCHVPPWTPWNSSRHSAEININNEESRCLRSGVQVPFRFAWSIPGWRKKFYRPHDSDYVKFIAVDEGQRHW